MVDVRDILPLIIGFTTIAFFLGAFLIILDGLQESRIKAYTASNETQTENWNTDVLTVDTFSQSLFKMDVNSSGGLTDGYITNNTIGTPLGSFVDHGTYYAGENGTIAFIGTGSPDTEVNVTYLFTTADDVAATTQNVTRSLTNISKQMPAAGTVIGVSMVVTVVMILAFY